MSQFEKMSRNDEQRVIRALEQVVELTNQGTAPSDALYKVATEGHFTPAIVRRMTEAFNVSKTLSHMKHANGPARAESFPLADADAVLAKIYPAEVISPAEKAASVYEPDDYKRVETLNFMRKTPLVEQLPWAKAAAEYDQDPNIVEGKRLGQLAGLKKAAERARADYRSKFDAMTSLLGEASEYFRLIGHEPFEVAEQKTAAEYGIVGRRAMDLVYQLGNLREKRAEHFPERAVFDPNRKPYSLISRAITATYELQDLAKQAAEAESKVKDDTPAPEPALLDSVIGADDRPFVSKAAFMGPGAVLDTLAGDPEASQAKAYSEVFDPAHEAQLQGAKTQAMLNDFVSNDPILSSYEPGEVMEAYNQVSQLAPSVAQQPSVMRGLLRRMIQQGGILEPHEAHQIADIEKRVRTPADTR